MATAGEGGDLPHRGKQQKGPAKDDAAAAVAVAPEMMMMMTATTATVIGTRSTRATTSRAGKPSKEGH